MLLDGNRGKWEARAGAPVSFDMLTPSRQYSYIRAVRRNLGLQTSFNATVMLHRSVPPNRIRQISCSCVER